MQSTFTCSLKLIFSKLSTITPFALALSYSWNITSLFHLRISVGMLLNGSLPRMFLPSNFLQVWLFILQVTVIKYYHLSSSLVPSKQNRYYLPLPSLFFMIFYACPSKNLIYWTTHYLVVCFYHKHKPINSMKHCNSWIMALCLANSASIFWENNKLTN